jgi:hypothetical protein
VDHVSLAGFSLPGSRNRSFYVECPFRAAGEWKPVAFEVEPPAQVLMCPVVRALREDVHFQGTGGEIEAAHVEISGAIPFVDPEKRRRQYRNGIEIPGCAGEKRGYRSYALAQYLCEIFFI